MANMKKIISVIMATLLAVSCNKPDNESPTPTPPTPKPPVQKEAVVIDEDVDTKPTITASGGSAKVTFSATESWTASVINTKADSWIALDKTSGPAGENISINITVTENDTPDDRSATVQIKAGSTSIDIVVSQKQKDAITITPGKNEFGPEGGELKIEIVSNISYTYSVSEDAKSWISESGTKALQTNVLTFAIAANDDVDRRSGTITIKSAMGTEIINVYQAGGTASIVISQSEYSVGAAGGIFTVEVRSNVNVKAAIPDGCSWISESSTKATSTNTFGFAVEANESLDDRQATLTFSDVDGKAEAETVTVKQAGHSAISVESVSLDKTSLEMTEGDTETLTAAISPANASNKNVSWSSDKETVATVKDGKVTAVAPGTATITVTTEDGEKTATCTVTVKTFYGNIIVSGEISKINIIGSSEKSVPTREWEADESITLLCGRKTYEYVSTGKGNSVEFIAVGQQLSGYEGETVYAISPSTEVKDGQIAFNTANGNPISVPYRIDADRLPQDKLKGVGIIHEGKVKLKFSLLFGYWGIILDKEVRISHISPSNTVRPRFVSGFQKGHYVFSTGAYTNEETTSSPYWYDYKDHDAETLNSEQLVFYFPIAPINNVSSDFEILNDFGRELACKHLENISVNANDVYFIHFSAEDIYTGEGGFSDMPIVIW